MSAKCKNIMLFKLFRKIQKYFFRVVCAGAFIQVLLGILGQIHSITASTIQCNLLSEEWLFYKPTGSLFVTFHIIVIIIYTASVNLSLYKIPKQFEKFNKEVIIPLV